MAMTLPNLGTGYCVLSKLIRAGSIKLILAVRRKERNDHDVGTEHSFDPDTP